MSSEPLPPAPALLTDGNGRPRYGKYQGWLGSTGLAQVRPRPGLLQRPFREKRWVHVGCYGSEGTLSLALIDLGYLTSAWSALWDARGQKMVANGSAIGPAGAVSVDDDPRGGARAHWVGVDLRVLLASDGESLRVTGQQKGLSIDVTIDLPRSAPALLAICETDAAGNDGLDVTHKACARSVRGEARVDGENGAAPTIIHFTDGDSLAAVDHTHGFLPRTVEWKWVSLQGFDTQKRPVGLNLTEGFTDLVSDECCAFLDGKPVAVGKARVVPGSDPARDPWTVTTVDGAVDLVFLPEAVRAESTDLGLIASRYQQPFGRFKGTVCGRVVDGAPGVTELHFAKW